MYGYSYRPSSCTCEDFPCCGCNDVDPDWQPDPYDAYDNNDFYDDLADLEDDEDLLLPDNPFT